MVAYLPGTINELLEDRCSSTGLIHFLDESGDVANTLTFQALFKSAQNIAHALLALGLKGGGEDIVVTNFDDQERHILLFWGCSFAGIPICPIAPLHPDDARSVQLFEHLQHLFHAPTFVSDAATIKKVASLVPAFKAIDIATVLKAPQVTDSSEFSGLIYPRRRAAPTDTVALMLTSGSTGNSKGVVIPHSMFLSSIRGKALSQGTTGHDVLFNWIHFDHVANVTEAHLHGIYSGATQYHVAPSAVIRRPRNILDWCSKYRVTQTFSPNFLLGQLCRDLSLQVSSSDVPGVDQQPDLSSLRCFISGGEANPVSTAVEFTDLIERFGAPRSVLRPGFGMTETGAGSIYNRNPILPSVEAYNGEVYLSLGTPCVGTQVRVMDPNSLFACAPRVLGQLQVAGPTVFRQYYANPRANAESFTADGWFITGDLALLDEHGALHLRGRDKADLNINGVKHACTDVERYLEDADIPGVRQACVFASALRLEGADTETYAIFYEHTTVDTDAIVSGAGAGAEEVLTTNEGIRTKSSICCSRAPHVVLPLPPKYFVKSALGKVSRPALVKAYQEGKFALIEEALTRAAAAKKEALQANGSTNQSAVSQALSQWVAETLDLDLATIDASQNIMDLGASSMHLMRLKQFLQDKFHLDDVPTIDLLNRPVIGTLASFIEGLINSSPGSEPSVYNPLVCLRAHGTKPALYLIHPGVGEILVFINVARALADDRPVFGVRARGFKADETPPESMEEMVRLYADAIVANDPVGPYFLGGYSFGGALAVEIGKVLEREGHRVAWVGIMNLPPHMGFRLQGLKWVETMINLCTFLEIVKNTERDDFTERLLNANPGGDVAEPTNTWEMVNWVWANCNRERLAEFHMPMDYFHRWANIAYKVVITGADYVPAGAVHGALTTVFCCIPLPGMGTKEEYKNDRLAPWKEFSGPRFELVDVDGTHTTMLDEEYVVSFTAAMKEALDRAESSMPPAPSP